MVELKSSKVACTTELAEMHGIEKSIITNIKKQKDDIENDVNHINFSDAGNSRKILKNPKNKRISIFVFQWFVFLQKRNRSILISEPIIHEKLNVDSNFNRYTKGYRNTRKCNSMKLLTLKKLCDSEV